MATRNPDIAQPELSPEARATRFLIAAFKQAVKDDASGIRAEKRSVRDLQRSNSHAAPAAQSRLARHRLEARARLLAYGIVRGRAWDAIEPSHAAATPQLGWAIQFVWTAARDATAAGTGVALPFPEALQACMPGGRA